jgi:hypothetical protein
LVIFILISANNNSKTGISRTKQPESLEAAFKARSTRNYQGRFFKRLKFESQSASGFGVEVLR